MSEGCELRRKFKQIKEEHGLIFPQLEEECGKIFFTLKDVDHRIVYMRIGGKFHLMLGYETSAMRAVIKALYDAGIVTENGTILYDYPRPCMRR